MVRAVGVDPGTRSFDIYGFDDGIGEVIIDETVPSEIVAKKPEQIIKDLEKTDADIIIGPSGYGLPLIEAKDLTERDHFLSLLVRDEDLHIPVLYGLRRIAEMMHDREMPVTFIPGVIHMPTVPKHRKANKIDMGTADKLACAVLAIKDQADRLGISYKKTSFILTEIGFGYTATMGVEDGQIVDGIGGSMGNTGFLSLGAMDGELAYLLQGFPKIALFSGGAKDIVGRDISPEELAKNRAKEPYKTAWGALIEGVVRNIATMRVSVESPKEILLSGRLSRVPEIVAELKNKFGKVRVVGRTARIAKEAAEGSMIIGNGLADGTYSDLVENLRIREAKGTSLDHIYVPQIEEVKKRYKI